MDWSLCEFGELEWDKRFMKCSLKFCEIRGGKKEAGGVFNFILVSLYTFKVRYIK